MCMRVRENKYVCVCVRIKCMRVRIKYMRVCENKCVCVCVRIKCMRVRIKCMRVRGN